MATIDDLVRLIPPPEAPVDATGDWEQVETDLGLELPSDFKMLMASPSGATHRVPVRTATSGISQR
jgi:hypothetical protein